MTQRLLFCLLFILAASFQSVQAQGKPAPAKATPDDDLTSEYLIVAKHSNKVLDVKDISKFNHAQVWQYRETRANNQRWFFLPSDDGVSYYIVSKNSKKCIEYKSDGTIAQEPISWKDEQRWELQATENPNEYIILSKKDETLCLNVIHASKNDGAPVILYSVNNNAINNSIWILKKLE